MYDETHVERLQFIRHCRSLDMTLDEVRHLLVLRDAPEDSCDEVNALLDQHIGHVAHRIEELRLLQDQLQLLHSRSRRGNRAKDCGILQGLAEMEGELRPANLGSHGGGCCQALPVESAALSS